MRARLKKKRKNAVEKLEESLMSAIREKDLDKVAFFLDKLHRREVHQGYAIEAAKRLLFGEERRRSNDSW
jgi:hypothetical protein